MNTTPLITLDNNTHRFYTKQPVAEQENKSLIVKKSALKGYKRVLIYGGLHYARKMRALVEMGCFNTLPIVFQYQLPLQSLRVLNQWAAQGVGDVQDLAERVLRDHNTAARVGDWNRGFVDYTDWQHMFAGTLPIDEYAYGKVRSIEVPCENLS